MKKRVYSIGASVQVQDGEAGRISRVITDRKTRKPTDLVVKFSWPFPREVAVPISFVQSATPSRVKLEVTREALEAFPDYEVVVRMGRYEKPFPVGRPRPVDIYLPQSNRGLLAVRQRSVPDGSADIHRGISVLDVHGRKVGTVDGILVREGEQTCRYLVLRVKGGGLRLAPAELVADVTSDAVRLKVDSKFVSGLLPYNPERMSRVWFS